MNAVFVTGTDTEVGKTVVCGLLARYLLERNSRVVTQKWIQTGSPAFSTDIASHLRSMKKTKKDVQPRLSDMAPYTFRFPASAHLAAKLEQKRISPAKIKKSFTRLTKDFDLVIVEALGGVLVPYNKKKLVVDIAEELKLPAIIVAKNTLGAINHTLLTIEALKQRNMKILGIIFNEQAKKEDQVILKDNPKIIKSLTGENILGMLPWQKDSELLYKAFRPIGKKLFDKICGETGK